MSWGILLKREIHWTYPRIQDIHLTWNILQRWMGRVTVAIQTASGGAGPEMSIEGVLQLDELRDYLYQQMRGARSETEASLDDSAQEESADEPLALLREFRDLIAASAYYLERLADRVRAWTVTCTLIASARRSGDRNRRLPGGRSRRHARGYILGSLQFHRSTEST